MDTYAFHEQATQLPKPPPVVEAAHLATMSDADHARHVAEVTRWIAGSYLETTLCSGISTAIDVAVTYNEATLPGSKTIVGLSGPNAAGKSTLAHRWSAEYYRRAIEPFPLEGQLPRWTPEQGVRADVAPVVWINLQSNAKIAELDAQILTFLRVGSTGTVRDMTLRTVRALARHRVRLLVIDDVHLLDTRSRSGRGVLDHIKHINTELGEIGGSLVLVGADLHRTELTHDPQIANRLRLLTLSRLAAATREERQAWKELLAGLEPQLSPTLPLTAEGYLAEHLAQPLYERSGGYLGELINVLKHCVIAAAITRSGTITRHHVETAPTSRRQAHDVIV